MTLEFLPEAQEEFHEAARYYEDKEAGLGKRFRDEVWNICSAILERPLLWRERPGGYRRVNCPVFPFHVAYVMRGETILVAAIAHGSRLPDYWKDRVS